MPGSPRASKGRLTVPRHPVSACLGVVIRSLPPDFEGGRLLVKPRCLRQFATRQSAGSHMSPTMPEQEHLREEHGVAQAVATRRKY